MESTLFQTRPRKLGIGLVHQFIFPILCCFVHSPLQRLQRCPKDLHKCCLKTKITNDKIYLSGARKSFFAMLLLNVLALTSGP